MSGFKGFENCWSSKKILPAAITDMVNATFEPRLSGSLHFRSWMSSKAQVYQSPLGMGLLTLAISLSAQAFVSCSAMGDSCSAAAAGLQESNCTKALAASILTTVTACRFTLVMLFHHYVKETSHPLPLLYNKAKHV